MESPVKPGRFISLAELEFTTVLDHNSIVNIRDLKRLLGQISNGYRITIELYDQCCRLRYWIENTLLDLNSRSVFQNGTCESVSHLNSSLVKVTLCI